jgi:hypothetical protein
MNINKDAIIEGVLLAISILKPELYDVAKKAIGALEEVEEIAKDPIRFVADLNIILANLKAGQEVLK